MWLYPRPMVQLQSSRYTKKLLPAGSSMSLHWIHNVDVIVIHALDGEWEVPVDRFTNHWGIDVSPTFSPDGKKMAFVSNRSGSPQIYIRDLINGGEQRVTFQGNYNTSPDWSSLDRIAFSAMANGRSDIFTIDADGRNLRSLTENQSNNEDPSWSPDGRYIIFSSSREGGYHLYMMNANGQNQRRITFLKGEQTAPAWSPY